MKFVILTICLLLASDISGQARSAFVARVNRLMTAGRIYLCCKMISCGKRNDVCVRINVPAGANMIPCRCKFHS